MTRAQRQKEKYKIRAAECARYNNVATADGEKYKWKPYMRGKN